MAKVNGVCDDRFTALQELFQKNLDSDKELGASIVVNINGDNVVDLWGGYADGAKTRAWEENTVTNVWSSSKNILSLAALVLIERGQLDPDEKVSKYWPEFAANGKENVLVRHILSHQSGLSGWEDSITVEDLCNAPKTTELLAKQAPWWTPGTGIGYHSLTMGHLVGEVVRRVTGKPLEQFIKEDLADPLGADYQLGAAEKDWNRVADVIPPPGARNAEAAVSAEKPDEKPVLVPGPLFMKTFANPPVDASVANTPPWRSSRVGAAGGHTNARGIARLLSVISLGGSVAGTTLLSQKTIDLIFEEQVSGVCQALNIPLRFGLGYALGGKNQAVNYMPEGKLCFWGGWGGSMMVMDAGRGVTVTYVMNKMNDGLLGEGLAQEYIHAAYKALGVGL